MEELLISRVIDEVRPEAAYLDDLLEASEEISDPAERQKLHECVGKLRLVRAELMAELVKRYPALDAAVTGGR
jgi:hypothetical protein